MKTTALQVCVRFCNQLVLIVVLVCFGCGRDESSAATPVDEPAAAPTLPKDAPETLPKVPASEAAISAMLRERFGDAVARTVRVAVEDKPEGLRVSLNGEVPNNDFRASVMREVEVRVENIKFQDFNLEPAGPVPMLFGFDANVREREFVHFAPDLSFAVTKQGGVYEMATGRRINRMNLGSSNDLVNMALSHDGRTLAVSFRGGEVALLEMPLGRNRRTLQPPNPPTSFDDVVAMAFSRDDKQLVTISRTLGDLRVWDLAKGSARQIGSHIPPNSARRLGDEYHIAVSPDGRTIATASFDLTELMLWDVAARSKLETPKIDRLNPKALRWSHDGQTIAVARTTENKRGVAVYDLKSKQVRVLTTEQDELIRGLAFSPDDNMLAVSYESNQATVRLWDLSTATVWQSLDDVKVGQPTNFAFSPNGVVLAMDCPGLRPASIRMWDVSKRPNGGTATAAIPPPLKDVVPQDDAFAAEVERRIRRTFDASNIESLQVVVLPEGTIKLTGKVAAAEVKRVAQLEAEVARLPEDIGRSGRNRIINELEVTGKYGDGRR